MIFTSFLEVQDLLFYPHEFTILSHPANQTNREYITVIHNCGFYICMYNIPFIFYDVPVYSCGYRSLINFEPARYGVRTPITQIFLFHSIPQLTLKNIRLSTGLPIIHSTHVHEYKPAFFLPHNPVDRIRYIWVKLNPHAVFHRFPQFVDKHKFTYFCLPLHKLTK